MELDLVIFDMDGVIFDSEKVYYTANKIAAKKLKMKYSLDYYKKFIGASTDFMKKQMIKDYDDNKELIDMFFKMSAMTVHSLVESGKLEIKKGFRELTEYLDNQKIDYALASSNDKSEIELFLKHTNIDKKAFKAIISADDVSAAKPSPDIFLKAWKKSGSPNKNKTLVIEDSLNGIKAANNAKLPVIMVPDIIKPNTNQTRNTITILKNLIEVRDFIAKNN